MVFRVLRGSFWRVIVNIGSLWRHRGWNFPLWSYVALKSKSSKGNIKSRRGQLHSKEQVYFTFASRFCFQDISKEMCFCFEWKLANHGLVFPAFFFSQASNKSYVFIHFFFFFFLRRFTEGCCMNEARHTAGSAEREKLNVGVLRLLETCLKCKR